MKTVAIIPARGGSRRLPLKNIRHFHGRPIISFSIDTALRSKLFDEVYVSTDSVEIATIAKHYGASTLLRPAYLAHDDVGTQTVMAFAVNKIYTSLNDFDLACCIYPTAPLLDIYDLREAHRRLTVNPAIRYCVTVGTQPLRDAGCFYFGRAEAFAALESLYWKPTELLALPESRVCDINIEADWLRAEEMYAELHHLNGGIAYG